MSTEIPEDGDASPIDPSMEKTPPFVQKLLQLLQDGRYTDFIDWTGKRTGGWLHNEARLYLYPL